MKKKEINIKMKDGSVAKELNKCYASPTLSREVGYVRKKDYAEKWFYKFTDVATGVRLYSSFAEKRKDAFEDFETFCAQNKDKILKILGQHRAIGEAQLQMF